MVGDSRDPPGHGWVVFFCCWGWFFRLYAFRSAKVAKPYLICQGHHPRLSLLDTPAHSPLNSDPANCQNWSKQAAFLLEVLHQALSRPEPAPCSVAGSQLAVVPSRASITPLFIALTIARKVRVQWLQRQTQLLLALNHNINLLLHITNSRAILLPGYKLQKGALGMLTSNKIALSLTFDPKG